MKLRAGIAIPQRHSPMRVDNYPIFTEDNILVANVKADLPEAKELVELFTDPLLPRLPEVRSLLWRLVEDGNVDPMWAWELLDD